MELRGEVNCITAFSKDGEEVELFYQEDDADCGAYSTYQKIGNKEYEFTDYVCFDIEDEGCCEEKGTKLPTITMNDCKSCVYGNPTKNMQFALNESKLELSDIKKIEVYNSYYEHATPVSRSYLTIDYSKNGDFNTTKNENEKSE